MSETVHYKGVLNKIERYENETMEQQCKRLLDGKELPSYFDTYAEYLVDEFYHEMTIQDGVVYRVERIKEVDPDGDIFNAKLQNDGRVEFEIRYYNGGCGFDEAIEEALEDIK